MCVFLAQGKTKFKYKTLTATQKLNEWSFLILHCKNYASDPQSMNIHTHTEDLFVPSIPLSH